MSGSGSGSNGNVAQVKKVSAALGVAGAAAGLAWVGAKLYKEVQHLSTMPTLPETERTGGRQVAEVLRNQGVKHMFVLSGGHIAPVYTESEKLGIRVVDVRHEVNTVFAADACARLTGTPGVAAVTAGPGVTNTVTAVQNAKMAESPVIILGGATSTILKGRGSLQDIDHMSVMATVCKWTASASRVADFIPLLEEAFRQAQSGVPGPVFLECPMDLLWPSSVVVDEMVKFMPRESNKSLRAIAVRSYLRRHLNKIYEDCDAHRALPRIQAHLQRPSSSSVAQIAALLKNAKSPVLVLGSQAMLRQDDVRAVQQAVKKIGAPTFLAGMARGLLGADNFMTLQYRFQRGNALRGSDVAILVGSVCDFRLKYGECFGRNTKIVNVNRGKEGAYMNRTPHYPIIADPATFLLELGKVVGEDGGSKWGDWKKVLAGREQSSLDKIDENAKTDPEEFVNPVHLCREINSVLNDDSILVVDGGDFVGTAAYNIFPRHPLSWLDPGVFGTLGVGAGFAMGAKLVRPKSEVWLIYGDGAFGFSMAELDTFARNGLGVICIIGNDAGWTQIRRDQERVLGSSTATVLEHAHYEGVADALGGKGFLITKKEDIAPVLAEAKKVAAEGKPVVVNCLIARNSFREGAISV